jgi:hypothetical protein
MRREQVQARQIHTAGYYLHALQVVRLAGRPMRGARARTPGRTAASARKSYFRPPPKISVSLKTPSSRDAAMHGPAPTRTLSGGLLPAIVLAVKGRKAG